MRCIACSRWAGGGRGSEAWVAIVRCGLPSWGVGGHREVWVAIVGCGWTSLELLFFDCVVLVVPGCALLLFVGIRLARCAWTRTNSCYDPSLSTYALRCCKT